MGVIRTHRPVLLIVAAFSRHGEALQWAREQLQSQYGEVAHESAEFAFDYSRYYDNEMGTQLRKTFWAFAALMDPASLPRIKHQTNALEEQLIESGGYPERRPLNLDPGYITEAKLVLATTKDRDHRIYLAEGIFAEVTLHFHENAWRSRPWTYPDYASGEYDKFLNLCRDYLRARYRSNQAT
jgi:hypothetical protein